jgi:hypothetical protein
MCEACEVKSIQRIVLGEGMEVCKNNGYGIVGDIPLTHKQIDLHHKELPWVLLKGTALLGLGFSQPTQNCDDCRLQHMEHSMSWTVWTTWG